MTSTITSSTASQQWRSRPDDERYVSLTSMRDHFDALMHRSRQRVVASKRLEAQPVDDEGKYQSLTIVGEEISHAPTHWSFGQLSSLAGAPAGYLRKLPSPLAADCINYGLLKREVEDVGVLLRDNHNGDVATLDAATGPNFGRVWNRDVLDELINRFGDGTRSGGGMFQVPGEFGQMVPITKDNTTLYASDRDFFVFLTDETNRIEIPNRRNGEPGQMARGVIISQSEVGARTLTLAQFLLDYVCMNRMIWGMTELEEVSIRHTASAPSRFLDEVQPALEAYRTASSEPIVKQIAAAKAKKIDKDLNEWLGKRWTGSLVSSMKAVHQLEEGRPIENVWDAVTAATAVARSKTHQDERVDLERQAGQLLRRAA